MAQLYYRYSTMNAGKSIELIKVAYNYEERGKHVLVLSPSVDDRYGVGKITSRIGISREALAIDATPVFLPGESQGLGSLVGCHLWGRTESDTTEVT